MMRRGSTLICKPAAPERGRKVKDWRSAGSGAHFVQFYRTGEYLIECLAGYVAEGIWAGERVIVIATPEHRSALEERLRIKNVDVAGNAATGRFLALDAREVLGRFMFGGRPDPAAFKAVLGELIRQGTQSGRPLRAFGEMVALLWAENNRQAAIELEELWNELAREYAFSLFCAYPTAAVGPKDGQPGLEHICQSHTCVVSAPA